MLPDLIDKVLTCKDARPEGLYYIRIRHESIKVIRRAADVNTMPAFKVIEIALARYRHFISHPCDSLKIF